MPRKPKNGLFITGTDTDVGKTYVGAMLARAMFQRGVRVGVYKPVASGCSSVQGNLVSEDARELWEAAGKPLTLGQVCPQMFTAPLAPHLAARVDGKQVDRELLRRGIEPWNGHDLVLVEGAGGLLSPISDTDAVADLAVVFEYPLLVVAANGLGAINQVLQTLVVAEHYKLRVSAIVLNDATRDEGDGSRTTNRAEISKRTNIPVLGPLSHGGNDPGCVDEIVRQLLPATKRPLPKQ